MLSVSIAQRNSSHIVDVKIIPVKDLPMTSALHNLAGIPYHSKTKNVRFFETLIMYKTSLLISITVFYYVLGLTSHLTFLYNDFYGHSHRPLKEKKRNRTEQNRTFISQLHTIHT